MSSVPSSQQRQKSKPVPTAFVNIAVAPLTTRFNLLNVSIRWGIPSIQRRRLHLSGMCRGRDCFGKRPFLNSTTCSHFYHQNHPDLPAYSSDHPQSAILPAPTQGFLWLHTGHRQRKRPFIFPPSHPKPTRPIKSTRLQRINYVS